MSGLDGAPEHGTGEWMRPLGGPCPAGPWLEYDAAYAALQARMLPADDPECGDLAQRRQGPRWNELERDCARLLERSRDLTLLVWWLRCRVRNAGAQGLQNGLRQVSQVVRALGAHIHPQAVVEGRHDPVLRANALAQLADPQGLLADLRDLVALRCGGEPRRLREVEHALGAGEAACQPMQRELQRAWQAADPHCLALHQGWLHLQALLEWAAADLGEHMPDLGALLRLLQPFARPPPPAAAQRAAEPAAHADAPVRAQSAAQALVQSDAQALVQSDAQALVQSDAGCVPQHRDAARRCIAGARAWFEEHEPSSPVAVLLRQAERLVGRRYADIVQAIPAELLARWEQAAD